jgi:hypothetical protein
MDRTVALKTLLKAGEGAGPEREVLPKWQELPELYSGTFYRIATPFPNVLQSSP